MIHPITSNHLLQNGKYFSLMKLIILQQNIASVWIFGDQLAWNQHGHEMDVILQHLVGTLPKYVYDLNATRTVCMDHDDVTVLNIIFVSQSFSSNDLTCTCPTDYTIVLVLDSTTTIRQPRKRSNNVLWRIAFGSILNSDIHDIKPFEGHSSLVLNTKALHNLFIPRPLKLNQSAVFRIGLQIRPPITMMYFLNNTYGLYGPDPQLAREISKMLNTTLIVQSNVGIEYPQFPSWYNNSDPRVSVSLKLLALRKRIIPPKAIYDFYRNCSYDDVDMCVTAQPLRKTDFNRTTFLYPHFKECLRIVVPYIKNEKQFAEKLANDNTVQSICLGIALMFISKIILNGSCRVSDWSHTFNVILAELLGQKRPKVSVKIWEKMWHFEVVLIAIFSTAFLSAISYQTLISVKYVKQIDTLTDLMDSDLKIYVEKFRSRDFDTWGRNLDPRLRSKFIYQNELLNMIMDPHYAAFVWDDGTAWLHIRMSEYFANDGGSAEMRMVKEPLYCGFTSSRVLSDSAFKHSINTLIERLFVSGIRMQWLEWSLQYLRAINHKTVNGKSNSNMQPLTLYRINGILALLIGGLVLGCVVFISEIVWKKVTPSQRAKAPQLSRVKGKVKRHVKRRKVIPTKKQQRIAISTVSPTLLKQDARPSYGSKTSNF